MEIPFPIRYSLFAIPQSNRIPGEDVARAVELVEGILERRHAVLGNALRRPAFSAMHRAQRTVLAEQENLVHAPPEHFPPPLLGEIPEHKGPPPPHLSPPPPPHLLDPCLLGFRFGRD